MFAWGVLGGYPKTGLEGLSKKTTVFVRGVSINTSRKLVCFLSLLIIIRLISLYNFSLSYSS